MGQFVSFQGTISQYFSSLNCPICDELTQQSICPGCMKDPQKVAVVLASKIQKAERVHSQLAQVRLVDLPVVHMRSD